MKKRQKPNNNRSRLIRVVILIAILILIEQLTKVYAINNTKESEKIIIKDVLSFSYLENTGIAFGIGQGDSTALIIASNIIVIALIIRFMVMQREKIGPKTMFLLSMAVAGGMSNLIDRIFRGYVVDFINLLIIPSYPRCNLADIFLVVSWFLLVFAFVVKAREELKLEKHKEEVKGKEDNDTKRGVV